MSPASKLKSKLKENSSVRAAKEQQKSVSKHSGPTSTGNGSPGSAYNPVSGTFHSFDTAQVTSSPPPHCNNTRFRNADETDEHSSSSLGTAAEYDSLSNNGSCSGESEDHKEKVASSASRQETIPGSDNEKREKIRQKNERKHQRQRERRAQELHERCSGYLMSRKLEALSRQLVAMGFSSERATLALMLNEGRVEESVNWLFEGNEEEAQKDIKNVNNLKIDISKELAQIAALELRYKCSKQEVERTVVACEGDLVKAEETLKMRKPEPAVTPTKPEETSNLKQPTKPQDKPMAAVATQSSRNEREMNYLKGAAGVSTISEPGSRNFLPLKTNQLESLVERRWLNSASSSSLSYSTVPPIQVAPSSAKMMGQLSVSRNEGRSVSQGAVREPVMMMQHPQAMNMKQNYVLPNNISASQPGTAEWYANNVVGLDGKKLNGVPLLQKSSAGIPGAGSYGSKHFYPQAQSNRSLGPENSNMRQYYPQAQYTQQSFATNSVDSAGGAAATRMGSSWSTMGASSPSRTVASSLGLFSSWGSTGTSGSTSHVDWNARDMMSNCDYNSIDWTLESNSKPSGLMLGLPSARVSGTNGGVQFAGLQNGAMSTEIASSGGGPREWTSPFAGNDIFSAPRQFVTSPSP